MSRRPPIEVVSFLTVENEDDLIVAFAIKAGEPGEVVSLIPMRTPKYEGLIDPEERGVKVSHEAIRERDDELLLKSALEPRQPRSFRPIAAISST